VELLRTVVAGTATGCRTPPQVLFLLFIDAAAVFIIKGLAVDLVWFPDDASNVIGLLAELLLLLAAMPIAVLLSFVETRSGDDMNESASVGGDDDSPPFAPSFTCAPSLFPLVKLTRERRLRGETVGETSKAPPPRRMEERLWIDSLFTFGELSGDDVDDEQLLLD
jgi:hypothetical protein